MTVLGRVFTFVILIASVAFFVAALLANASHLDYKDKLASLRTQVDQLKKTVQETKSLNERLQTNLSQEQLARRSALAALQQRLADDQLELENANKKLADLNSANTQKTQQAADAMDRLKAVQGQNDALRAEIDKVITDRNEKRYDVIRLTDKLNQLLASESDLKAEKEKLLEQATYFEALSETRGNALKSFGLEYVVDTPPADLKGVVNAVNNNQLVEISLGKDDGLREGHTLEVYRGAQYLGRIQITTAREDKAIGKILTSFRKGYIQAGDTVASKIQ